MSKISSHDMCTKLHGCPFYQAGISSLWGSDLSLLQRLWYFAPRKAEQVSNRLRGKPGKMSVPKHGHHMVGETNLYIHEFMLSYWIVSKNASCHVSHLHKCLVYISVRMLATWLLLMSRVDKSNLTCSLTAWTHLQERMTVIFSV